MEYNEIIQTLSQSALVGTGLSLVMQFIKNKFGFNSNRSKAIVLFLSLCGASAFWILKDTQYWMPLVGILGTASTVYNFIIRSTPLNNIGKSEEEIG